MMEKDDDIERFKRATETFSSIKDFATNPFQKAIETRLGSLQTAMIENMIENIITQTEHTSKKEYIPIGAKLSPGEVYILCRNDDGSIDIIEYINEKINLKRIYMGNLADK